MVALSDYPHFMWMTEGQDWSGVTTEKTTLRAARDTLGSTGPRYPEYTYLQHQGGRNPSIHMG